MREAVPDLSAAQAVRWRKRKVINVLEYVFFDTRPRQRFVDFLRARGIEPQLSEDDEVLTVALSDELDEVLGDEIEVFYDQMLEYNQELHDGEAAAGDDGYYSAGVVLNLKDGVTVYAQVDPRLLGRIMQVLTPQEFGDVVNAIVDAVESPDSRTMCQRMRGDDQV